MLFISDDSFGEHEDKTIFETVKYQSLVCCTLYDNNFCVHTGNIDQTGRHSQCVRGLQHLYSSYNRRSFPTRYSPSSSLIFCQVLSKIIKCIENEELSIN